MLKKQLLNHDRKLLEENTSLKEAFAASDEARTELETAFDLLKQEHDLLKTDMSNIQASTDERLIIEKKLVEFQELIDNKNMENEKLLQENEEIR